MTRRRAARFAYRIGEGVVLRKRPELGVAIILGALIVNKRAEYFIEWPKDQDTGLQSRRTVESREVRSA